jgi:hypothetical protein
MAKTNYDAINFKNKDVDKFSTRFGNGDPIKLKNSPLSGPFFKKASEGNLSDREKESISYSSGMGSQKKDMSKGASDANYMAKAAWSNADRAEAMNRLRKEDPKSLSKYGFQTTSKGNVVDENYAEKAKNDASRLRDMATKRPINDRYAKDESLRGSKLAEGIQTPSMTKSKKPIIAAPKIDVKAAKAKVKADAKREFYTNSKGQKVYVD